MQTVEMVWLCSAIALLSLAAFVLALWVLALWVLALWVLALWRASDARAERHARARLIELGASERRTYTPALVAGLPEPARRYFNYTIRSGTILRSAVEIEMGGVLGLGTQTRPNYRPMQARQILAPPFGFVWNMRSGGLAGSDGATPEASWTRFWLFGLIPAVRAGGPDHRRSAFGRVISEAAFWAPASLLPGPFVRWHPLDQDSARAVFTYQGFTQAVDITVDEAGAPAMVVIQRWSNENADKTFREQPFGGYLTAFRDFDGYRLPTRVEGGNLIGTPDYFPFFKAHVTGIRFPQPPSPFPEKGQPFSVRKRSDLF